ncbi:MAG: hypothetical protein ACOC3G_05980 [Phycisphaeraceae bacterium]
MIHHDRSDIERFATMYLTAHLERVGLVRAAARDAAEALVLHWREHPELVLSAPPGVCGRIALWRRDKARDTPVWWGRIRPTHPPQTLADKMQQLREQDAPERGPDSGHG